MCIVDPQKYYRPRGARCCYPTCWNDPVVRGRNNRRASIRPNHLRLSYLFRFQREGVFGIKGQGVLLWTGNPVDPHPCDM